MVTDLVLRQDGGGDGLLQVLVGGQHLKPIVQAGGDALAVLPPLGKRTDGSQGARYPQQLCQRQHGPRPCTAQSARHVFGVPKGGGTEFCHEQAGGVGLRQQAVHLVGVHGGDQPPRRRRGVLTGRVTRQQLQHRIQLQCLTVFVHISLLMYGKNPAF